MSRFNVTRDFFETPEFEIHSGLKVFFDDLERDKSVGVKRQKLEIRDPFEREIELFDSGISRSLSKELPQGSTNIENLSKKIKCFLNVFNKYSLIGPLNEYSKIDFYNDNKKQLINLIGSGKYAHFVVLSDTVIKFMFRTLENQRYEFTMKKNYFYTLNIESISLLVVEQSSVNYRFVVIK